jgi:hypothetical protein
MASAFRVLDFGQSALFRACWKESNSVLGFSFAMVDCCSNISSEGVVEAIERLKRNDPTLTELE